LRFLVTGGAGFLGRNLCKSLLEDGYSVLAIDNLVTGSLKNLVELNSHNSFQFIEADVRDFNVSGIDGIFNLACPASPPKYQSDPVDTFLTSVLGAKRVLEIANLNRIPVLQASTSEVYGDPEVSPQHENYWGNVNPIGIRSCYDEGKRAAETLFYDYMRTKATNIRVARIFNTYGPYMAPNDGRVVSNFIMQALTNSPITVFGTGTQTRSFCYVDDLVRGLKQLMFREGTSEPINLGNPETFTMLELANMIVQLTGSSSKITFKSLPQDDPKNRRPDISNARRYLDFDPVIGIYEGLEKTIRFFRETAL
jgi:UDP-glucuronate decarboxylase